MKRIEQEQHGDDVDTARRVTLDLERAAPAPGLYSQVQQRLTFLATQAETGEQLQGVSQHAIEEADAEAERLAALIPDAEAASIEAQQATRIAAQELDAIDEHIAQQSALVSQHDLELAGLRGRVETAKQSLETLMREAGRRGEAHAQAEERLTAAQAALAEFTEASEAEALPENRRTRTLLCRRASVTRA